MIPIRKPIQVLKSSAFTRATFQNRGRNRTLDSEKLAALYFYYTNKPMSARWRMQILSDLRKNDQHPKK